jgi:PAS domain S-box-containing protein
MLAAVIEHLTTPAFRIDRSGRILEANASFEAELSNPPGDLAGITLDELRFKSPAISSLILKLNEKIAEALDSGKNIDFSHTETGIATGFSIIIDAASPEATTCICIITGTVPERRDLARSTGELLQSLPDLMPGPTFTLDPKGLVTGWSRDARHAMFGVDNGSPSGLNLFDTVHHEDRDELCAAVTVSLNGDVETSCEVRILHRRRMVYLWHSISTRRILANGKPSVIATAREITKCKQLEESLQISEAKFKRLFDGHATTMLLIDARTKAIIDANHAASSFYGWSIEELQRMNLKQLSTKSPQRIDHEIELIKKLKQKIVLSRHRRADGSLRDVEVSTTLIEIQGHEVFYCIINDLTERLRVEKELRISKSQLDFALEKSHIGWWSMKLKEGRLLRTLELARIFGYSSTTSEWTYKRFLEHVIPQDRKLVYGIVEVTRHNLSEWNFECRIRRADGEIRWILVAGGFQKDETGDEHRMSGIVMDISERKLAEIELRDNRKRFELALEAARAGVWEMNIETGKAFWSNEIERLLGMTQQKKRPSFELWMKAIHPDDRQMVIDTITETNKQAIESSMEFRVCWPDGTIRWLMSRGQPVYNESGKWTGYIGTMIDTTERQEMLDSIQQSELEYRKLFENMPNGFAFCKVLYNEDGVVEDYLYIEINRKFGELLSLENVIGKRATEIIPEIRTSDPEIFSVADRVVKNGQPEYFDYFLNALQEWFSFLVYSPKRDYFIVIFDIITKRKQIEQSLRESEHKFRMITEQISEIVFVTDFTGIVRYISPSIEKTAGYHPEEVIAHSFFEFIDKDETERARQKIGEAIANHLDTEIFDLKYKKKDGAELYGEVGVRYFQDADDTVFSGMIGVIRDITQRKKDEEEKKRLELQLQKAERLETIGKLAGGIAHDFNNLLTPILGYAELGMLTASEEGYDAEYYTAIVQAAERAKHLISQILTFSKAHETAPKIARVQAIVKEALQLLRPSIPSNIRIEQHIDNTCGNILIDPSKLHQVIVNLCTNAWQAIDKSYGVITMELREVTPDSALLQQLTGLTAKPYAELSISDNGIGMDKATMEHIFEPFFTTKAADKGSGLGLSVVHGIITGYKGEIMVESEPGVSTTFRIYLPIVEEVKEPQSMPPAPQRGKGRILFVDDEELILNMITSMLTKQGFEVITAKHPREAVELFRQQRGQFDLVITDLTMPELSGLELAAELKKVNPKVPIILMTGYGKDIEEASALSEYGICQILKKPVRLAKLVSAVNETIAAST